MVFVIGASGFIGKYVVGKLLKLKYRVIVLVRDVNRYHLLGEECVIEGTLNNFSEWSQTLKDYPIDSCINLAWEGIPDFSYEMCKKNILYGMNVLEICREVGIKHLVVTGSCGEYDNPFGGVSEKWETSSKNHFKAAKSSLRMICDAFCKENNIQCNWLRLFFVYGPGQRKDSLIPYIIKEFSQGRQPELKGVYNENDFIFVSDAADAIVKVIQRKPKADIMNVGLGCAVKVKNIVDIVAAQMGFEFDGNMFQKKEEFVSFYADMSLTSKMLDWEGQTSIGEGIALMIQSLGLE